MKRNQHIFLLLCMLISAGAKSQFNKGDRLIGGAVNVYSSNNGYTYQNTTVTTNTSNYFGSGFVPRYSWVCKNNVMNGIFLNGNYSHSKSYSTSNSNEYSKSDYFSVGAGYFIRKYNDFNRELGWFLEYNGLISYGVNKQAQTIAGNASNYKSSSVTAGINIFPGLYYKVSPAVLIEAGLGGINASYSKGKGNNTESHGFNVGLNFPSNFTFGLNFFMAPKRIAKS